LNPVSTNNNEIDIKSFLNLITKYKKSIAYITLLFFIGSFVISYFKPNIYLSKATIEIFDNEDKTPSSTDFMKKAFGGYKSNIDNEMAVLKSRFIVQKALNTLNLSTNYYTFNKWGKKRELYKESPFIVTSEELNDFVYSKQFKLIPIDQKKFKLILMPLSKISIKHILSKVNLKKLTYIDKLTYEKIHTYGEKITTPMFSFTINKISQAKSKEYIFNFTHKKLFYDKYIKNLSISVVAKYASVLSLSFKDNVPLRAKEILNAISDTYIHQSLIQKSQRAKSTIGFINTQLDTINKRLQSTEQNVQNYKIKNKLTNINTFSILLAEKSVDYNIQKNKIQTEIKILNNLHDLVKKNKKVSGLVIGNLHFTDRTIPNLINTLRLTTTKKDNLLVDYTELHPDVKKISDDILSLKKTIITTLENQLNQLKQREKDILDTIKKQNIKIKTLPRQEKELARLSRPLEVNGNIYEFLLQKKAETSIIESSTISKARILDYALTNFSHIQPKRTIIILVGVIIGFILGISQAFFRESFITTIQSAEDIEKLSSLPLYGKIPLESNKVSKTIFTESLRNLRANLQFLPENKNHKVISITSSISGEGKTTIVASLSEVLARGSKKVIILDLDLRKASLHKTFNLKNDVGIYDYLTSKQKLKTIIQETDIPNLKIISSGNSILNPSELLLSPTLNKLFSKLRKKYDYIVIDTPPVGLISDAIVIMNYSDISLSIIRENYTKKIFLNNIDIIANNHTNNKMGLILNAAKIDKGYDYAYENLA